MIDAILEADRQVPRKQRHTAKRIFERLRDEHGFDGQYTILKDYVRERRRRTQEMFVPLSHAPGHAQCDFGEARVIIGGVERKAHYLVLDLPHSDGCFVKAYPAETTEAFLLRLSELELIDRHQRMAQRRIRAARFPAVKSLDTFDFLAIPPVNKQLVMELARCEYIEHRENVIAVGNSGTGKTHVALGLGLAACQKGMSVGFTTAAALVHELMEARDDRRLLPLEALSRETWLRKPPRSEEGPRVDGALTTQPRAPAVPPVRSTSASSMQSPPASAEAARVSILSPAFARPGASPRSR